MRLLSLCFLVILSSSIPSALCSAGEHTDRTERRYAHKNTHTHPLPKDEITEDKRKEKEDQKTDIKTGEMRQQLWIRKHGRKIVSCFLLAAAIYVIASHLSSVAPNSLPDPVTEEQTGGKENGGHSAYESLMEFFDLLDPPEKEAPSAS